MHKDQAIVSEFLVGLVVCAMQQINASVKAIAYTLHQLRYM